MRKNTSESGSFNPRVFLSSILCSAGVLLALAGITPPTPPNQQATNHEVRRERYLERMEVEWNNRLTYPTGIFNPEWLRVSQPQRTNSCRYL
jgi:hypothetical protein